MGWPEARRARFRADAHGFYSSAAEGRVHALLGQRWVGQICELGLVVVRSCKHAHERLKRLEISADGGHDGLLDAVITGDERGVDVLHRTRASFGADLVFEQPSPPRLGPCVERSRLLEERCNALV